MNQIVNTVGVSDEKQVAKLRSFKDKVKTYVDGIDLINVQQETYTSIVVEALQGQI